MFDFSRDGAVALLTINRPDARNAIRVDDWDKLAELVADAANGGARLLVLTGAEGCFCAGADITEFDRFRDDVAARSGFRLAMRRGIDALGTSELVTIAAIEGACFGAAVALAMACDIRVAAMDARIAITPAKLGMSYPQEDVHRLVTLVGRGQAARLLLGASIIDGAEAARIGLVDVAVKTHSLQSAMDLARRIVGNNPESVTVLKRAITLVTAGVRGDALQDEAFDDLLGSDALTAGLDAYRKRAR